MNAHIWRVVVLSLLAAASACSGKKAGEESAGPTDTNQQAEVVAPGQDAPSDDPEARAKEIGALVKLIVADASELPRTEFDPAALAERLGRDPAAHFEWVRDHTSWVPYRGLLRGSNGVMLDRVGSSLDRATLLGDLLRRSGYTVRLAHAQLPDAMVRKLLGTLRSLPARRISGSAQRAIPAERQRAIESVLPGYQRNLERQLAQSKRRAAEADALVRSQTEALLATVRPTATLDESDDAAALAALRDHWWIEREENGKWIAMDPLLPEAKVGEAQASATAISGWQASEEFPSIPDSDWHTVDIQVVVERFEAGTSSEAIVLKKTMRPAALLGRPLRLYYVPVPWPEPPPDPKGGTQTIRDAALGTELWVPVLQIGDERVIQSAFTVSGDVKSNLVETVDDVRRVAGTEVVSGMDMALGGFSAEEATPSATAVWLDYEIHVPGAAPQKLRREVFDLLGPARRSSKEAAFDGMADLPKLERFEALWSQTDILLQPCDFTEDYVAHLTSAGILANQEALSKLVEERDAARAKSLSKEILGKLWIWGPLPNLTLWRRALSGQPPDWFLDRPNILNYRVSRNVVSADQTSLRQLMDIVSNSVTPRGHGAQEDFAIRVRQGVADTVAEMAVLGSDFRAAGNTASVFGRLAAENSRGLLVEARDSAAARALPWPPDELARVVAHVESGYVVLVPRKAVVIDDQEHVGWWRVDPTSGETIGVMDTGFHADTAEYTAARAQQGRLFNWLYESGRYREWQDLRWMAQNNIPMSAESAYNLRLFNLTQRAIEDIAFFVL